MPLDTKTLRVLTRLLGSAETDEERGEVQAQLDAWHAWPGDDDPPEVIEYLNRRGVDLETEPDE